MYPVLRKAGISGKTWSGGKEALRSLELLSSKGRRVFSKVVTGHRLTGKGREIAGSLHAISSRLRASPKEK